MKKSILFLAFCLFVTIASGQSRKFYYMYAVEYEEYPMNNWIIIDLDKKEIEHDIKGDDEDEPNPKIVDYKKTSNGESFNSLFHGMKTPYVISPKRADGTYFLSVGDLSNGGAKYVVTLDEKQQKEYINAHAPKDAKESGSPKNPNEIKENSTGKVKNGAKNLLNTGKNLFKKKDKK